MEIIRSNAGVLLDGLTTTILLTVLGYLGALVVGIVVAIFRVSPIAPLRAVGTVYVEFFRNVPLLSLLILVAFGLPDAGLLLPLFWCGVVSLIASGSAFVCESVRSGINTVSLGQSEAARALGMGFGQQLRLVILPQALASMVQPLVNVLIGTLIGSSLCSAIGISEITNVTQQLNIKYAEAVLLFLVSGVAYLVMALGSGALGGVLERRVARSSHQRRQVQA
ncbi:glutamate transport system permease protein [Propionibacterium cyclohexanicum]|uniref:Glutamate transport system permease protein n=1 Tax=Propionibacterium cyclohexanicum TaxID=64702 RepID=A0A1H9Q9E5_9ACTN|nr:amino acid ABC transporter permease [Propionibacterium cyclohexanicum]SER56473.1 glutamate transport system permease protein [Propionibacterium cyclohexanicum]